MQIQNSIHTILARATMCISYTAASLWALCGKKADIAPVKKSCENEMALLYRFNNDLQDANSSYSQEIKELTKKHKELVVEKTNLILMIYTFMSVYMIMMSSYAVVIYTYILFR